MGSSSDWGSADGRAPRTSIPRPSSRSRGRSARPAPDPAASRLLFETRRQLPVPLAVEVGRLDAAPCREYATNLSPSGLCLHARGRLGVGEGVTLAFALPGEPAPIETRGRVIWREEPDPDASARFLETGVRFEALDERDREQIARFVREAEPG